MARYKWCEKHGLYNAGIDNACPKCKPEPSKRSKKYGGKAVIIPPHMKAREQ